MLVDNSGAEILAAVAAATLKLLLYTPVAPYWAQGHIILRCGCLTPCHCRAGLTSSSKGLLWRAEPCASLGR
jgi:hypothetical protein